LREGVRRLFEGIQRLRERGRRLFAGVQRLFEAGQRLFEALERSCQSLERRWAAPERARALLTCLELRPRMGIEVDIPQSLGREVCVDLSRSDVGVAEHLLQRA
jgi:hypothetical protein